MLPRGQLLTRAVMEHRLTHFLIAVVFPEQNNKKKGFSYHKNKYIAHFGQGYSLMFPVIFTKKLFTISGVGTEM